MKRTITALLLTVLLTPAIFSQEAVIRELFGTVEIKTPDSPEWIPAEAGMLLTVDTIVSTGFKSTAVIILGNSALIVRPLTRLSLEALAEKSGAENVALYLRTGRVRADVRPPEGGRTEFIVSSPMATASVRGTIFEFDTQNIRVNSGTVSFTAANTQRPVLVSTGKTSRVEENSGKTVGVFTAAEEELVPAIPAAAGNTRITGTAAAVPPAATAAIGGRIEWQP